MRFILSIVLISIFPCIAIGGPSYPPYYEAVMKVIDPLEYSGVPVMVKPQVKLSIDFGKWQWTLHNVHEYDSQGAITLEQGRFGLCAELATFVFEKIRPLLDIRYEVKFAMVAESDFFSEGQSNHIVLLVIDKFKKEVYLIDPSFHKYANIKDLKEYQVINIQESLSFVKDKSHDVSFGVDRAIPLYIKDDFLLSFSITSIDGKFDKDNFLFVISANRRNKFAGRDVLVIGRHNKAFEDFEDKALFDQLLTPDETKELFEKLKSWIRQI
jgi:hypothetical protein